MKLLLLFVMPLFSFFTGSIYDYTVTGLDGQEIRFDAYKGKKILIVNTASRCGLTPQYEELELLYKTYGDKLVVVGFPANNFMGQEPGSNQEISEFCKRNYGVSFPMAEKISVKGDDIHPLYQFLKEEAQTKGFKDPVSWNFGKFLLNENGELVATFSPRTTPMSQEILDWLK